MKNTKRTTLVDNNTWNNSHIAMVGKAMASNEDDAYTIMQELGVDYVLVIFGGLLGNSVGLFSATDRGSSSKEPWAVFIKVILVMI